VLRSAPFHFAREGERRPPDLVEAEARLYAHVDVHAARSRRLGPPDEPELVKDVAHKQSHAPHLVPGHARAGIEIDAQLVGMLEVVGAHRVRIEINASQVHDPQKLRRIAHDDLPRRPTRWKAELDRFDPLGPPLRGALLEERLTQSPIHVALEHDRPPRDATQRAVGDRRVVPREVELRVASLREERLVGTRDHHLATRDRQHGLALRSHRDSVARLSFAAQGRD
jgi:hypothetical protein